MPIAVPPVVNTPTSTNVVLATVQIPAGPAFAAGSALAIVGTEYQLASCTLYAEQFIGFLRLSSDPGSTPSVTVGRGSKVTPIVEGSVPLTTGLNCYLSSTPGQITQTAPSSGTILRVGFAVSAQEMLLVLDSVFQVP